MTAERSPDTGQQADEPKSGTAIAMKLAPTRGEATAHELRGIRGLNDHDRELVLHAADMLEIASRPRPSIVTPELAKQFEDLTQYRPGYWRDQICLIANGKKTISEVADAFNAAIQSAALSAPSHALATTSVDIERVKAWFYSKPRKRAEAAFTAGDERQLAYMLEDASEGILSQSATRQSIIEEVRVALHEAMPQDSESTCVDAVRIAMQTLTKLAAMDGTTKEKTDGN